LEQGYYSRKRVGITSNAALLVKFAALEETLGPPIKRWVMAVVAEPSEVF